MQTLHEVGQAVAERRKQLGLRQSDLAARSGIPAENISRLERGHLPEFGARKLLALLAVLGMELAFVEEGQGGNLDELSRERGSAR